MPVCKSDVVFFSPGLQPFIGAVIPFRQTGPANNQCCPQTICQRLEGFEFRLLSPGNIAQSVFVFPFLRVKARPLRCGAQDNPVAYPAGGDFHSLEDLDIVQKPLQEVHGNSPAGVSVDQVSMAMSLLEEKIVEKIIWTAEIENEIWRSDEFRPPVDRQNCLIGPIGTHTQIHHSEILPVLATGGIQQKIHLEWIGRIRGQTGTLRIGVTDRKNYCLVVVKLFLKIDCSQGVALDFGLMVAQVQIVQPRLHPNSKFFVVLIPVEPTHQIDRCEVS